MNIDEQLRTDLRDAPLPATLVPPTDLADRVLRTIRRQRRRRLTLTGACALAAVAVAVPLIVHTGPRPDGFGQQPGGSPVPAFASPGGGPVAIHAYASEGNTYLLDPDTGDYRALPFTVVLSPDTARAAVLDGDRVGIADRPALLDGGLAAVTWTGLPPGSGLAWSPDGTALLITSLDRGSSQMFTAHRYDLDTGAVTDTPIVMEILGSSVGWAADSERYLALERGITTNDTVEPGALRYLKPDGTAGAVLASAGGLVSGPAAYSPSRNLMVADTSNIMSAQPLASPVIDLRTGQPVATVPARHRPVGWYDEQTLIRLALAGGEYPVMELVDLATGSVKRRIELTGAVAEMRLQLGPATGLSAAAAERGF